MIYLVGFILCSVCFCLGFVSCAALANRHLSAPRGWLS